jgi:hypothetical protein
MKRNIFNSGLFSYALFLAIVFIFSCNKKEQVERPFPVVTTNSVEVITDIGARAHGSISSADNESIIEYGFAWNLSPTFKLENSPFKVVGQSYKGGAFEAILNNSLTKGRVYYVSAYAKTSELVIYGNPCKFTAQSSTGPKISAFRPNSAAWGDTVSIIGSSFSNGIRDNFVNFNGANATVIYATDTLVKVKVPDALANTKSILSIMIGTNYTVSKDSFTLKPLHIANASPLSIRWGDSLIIQGNFNLYESKINLGNFLIQKAYVTNRRISFAFPDACMDSSYTIKIQCKGQTDIYPSQVKLIPGYISYLDTMSALMGTIINAHGYFNKQTTVYFNDIAIVPIGMSRNICQLQIPYTLIRHAYKVKVITGLNQTSLADSFRIPDPVITSIVQENDKIGAQVVVSGANFNHTGLVLKIGNTDITPDSVFINRIKFRIPQTILAGTYDFSLRMTDRVINLPNAIKITAPGITGYSQLQGGADDTLTLFGKNLHSDNISVSFRYSTFGYKATVLENTDDYIKFVIPRNLNPGSYWIYFSINGIDYSDQQIFVSGTPQITSVLPLDGKSGDLLTISGKYLSAKLLRLYWSTSAQNLDAKDIVNIESATKNIITFKIPTTGASDHYLTMEFQYLFPSYYYYTVTYNQVYHQSAKK